MRYGDPGSVATSRLTAGSSGSVGRFEIGETAGEAGEFGLPGVVVVTAFGELRITEG